MNLRGLAVSIVPGILLAAACSNNPAGPGPGPGACRNYAAAFTRVTTTFAGVQTATGMCEFDTAARELTCNESLTDTLGNSGTERTEMRYPSVAAFVDEVRVIPPIARAQSATTVITSAGFTTTVESTWTYDAQNRLVQRYESNLGSTTIFTAWDASGRPTAAHFATSSDTYTLVYNDAARSATSTATSPSSGVQGVTTTVYDTNGNPVSSNMTTATPLGQFVTSIIYSTSTTRQVCS